MAINARLQRLLDVTRSSYAVLPHAEAFTAQQVARQVHVTGRHFAKVVVIRDEDARDAMVVIPATERLDPELLRRATGRTGFHLEDEGELRRLFPDCAVGAMPPFGALYGMPMYVDPCLLEAGDIFFQAGNHHEVVLMRTQEYGDIAGPLHARACLHRGSGRVERKAPRTAEHASARR